MERTGTGQSGWPVEGDAARAAREAGGAQPLRTLVIDDDPSTRELLTALLEEEGYAVRVAASGPEGLRVLREWQPHVILLDLILPEMDGTDFLAEQRRLGLDRIPVIVITAASYQELILDPSPAAIISKPFDLEALLDCIRKVLGPGR